MEVLHYVNTNDSAALKFIRFSSLQKPTVVVPWYQIYLVQKCIIKV